MSTIFISIRMLKNSYSFLILLLFAYFILKIDGKVASSTQNREWEEYFEKVIEFVRKDINYKVAYLVRSFVNLPATISDEDGKVSEYINQYIDIAVDFDSINIKIEYQLFTPTNPQKAFLLELSPDSFHRSKFNSNLGTKFLIHGFHESLSHTSVIYDIKDQLLKEGNYNIIVVDWSFFSRFSYDTAATNAIFIGYFLARLIKVLMHYKGVNPKSIHIIAHSLGCHMAGNAGKITPNLGRITCLDGTGLVFDNLPSSLKITNTDAEFVDAIHTHGANGEYGGLGTLIPYGDIDFYPNGGNAQPGCNYGNVYINTDKIKKLVTTPLDLIFCNHQRALFLFLDSINECRFESVKCTSYNKFKEGYCPRETSVVSRMGFYAKKDESLPTNTRFYLETNDKYPFCFENV